MRDAVLAGLLYIPKESLANNAILRYTLDNPAYSGAIKSGVRNPKMSKKIVVVRDFNDYHGFPPYAEPLLVGAPGLHIKDLRVSDGPFAFKFDEERLKSRPKFYPHQKIACDKLVTRGHGILVAKPAHGKTNIMIWALSKIGKKAIIFVNQGQLAGQWKERFLDWTDIKESDICMLGNGEKGYNGEPICIAMFQTSYQSLLSDKEIMHNFPVCVGDEIHHLSALTFAPSFGACRAFHKFGCTATPYREDKLDRIFMDNLGGITAVVPDLSLTPDINIWPFTGPIDMSGCVTCMGEPFLPEMINRLVDDAAFNDLCFTIMSLRQQQGYKSIMISDRSDHCVMMAERLKNAGFDATFIVSGYHDIITGKPKTLSVKRRKERYIHKAICATPGCMGEGIDIDDLDHMLLATPFGARTRAEQNIGRIQRYLPSKHDPPVVDDIMHLDHKMLISLAYKRQRTYRTSHWPIFRMTGGIRTKEDTIGDNTPLIEDEF